MIRYVYATYSNLDEILASPPYGGSTIAYAYYEASASSNAHFSPGYYPGTTEVIPIFDTQYVEKPHNWSIDRDYLAGDGFPNNRVFVLTVTCNYPFSSSMVRMLFGGGVNTKKCKINGNSSAFSASLNDAEKGTMYILWARGAGIVNPK